MRDDRNKELSKTLRAADPVGEHDLRGWADSEAGRRAYARILALREKESHASPAGIARKRMLRLALVAAGCLVVVAVVVTAVIVGTREPSGQMVASTSTTAAQSTSTTAIAPEDGVDRFVALAAVVRTVEGLRGSTGPQLPRSPADDPIPYVERAESLGITLPAERETLMASEPVSRGVYALWLWRAFADLLPRVREVDFPDLGSLSEDVHEAVIGVSEAGILDGRPTGRFEADQPLTVEEEQAGIARLWLALGLSRDVTPSD
jgi:hypothetical protein